MGGKGPSRPRNYVANPQQRERTYSANPKQLGKLEALATDLKNPQPKPLPRDTALGFCAGYQVYTKFLESVVHVFQTQTRIGWLISTISGPAMMDARRDIMRGFIEDTTADYLMMVDADIEFYPGDIQDLYQHLEDPEVGMASGVYVDSNGYAVAGDFDDDPGKGYSPLRKPPVGPSVVDAVGAGFVLIKRSLFEGSNAINSPANSGDVKPKLNYLTAFDHIVLPATTLDHNSREIHKVLGEDVSFCRRLKEAGYKIILDPDVFLGHLKVRRLYPDGRTLP